MGEPTIPVHVTRHFGARIAAADALREAVRRVVVDPPYHDCRGPSCLLCGLSTALRDFDEEGASERYALGRLTDPETAP